MSKVKTLCLCAGGVVRSVTLAALLKYNWKQDALSASLDVNKGETMWMLMDWADHIYIVEPDMWCEIPEDFKYKTRVLNIGPDIWGKSMEPTLIRICYDLLVADLGPPRTTKTIEEIVARRAKYTAQPEVYTPYTHTTSCDSTPGSNPWYNGIIRSQHGRTARTPS